MSGFRFSKKILERGFEGGWLKVTEEERIASELSAKIENAKRVENTQAGHKEHVKRLAQSRGKPAITVVRETLKIAGPNIEHTVYHLPVYTGFERTAEAIEKGAEKRKESRAKREKLDEALAAYAAKYPLATKDDKEAIAELAKVKAAFSEEIQSREDNLRRSIRNFGYVVNANWNRWTHFFTLTYKTNMVDQFQAAKDFEKFMKKLTRKYPNLIYCKVIEFQDRAAVHFHIMLGELGYDKMLPKKDLEKIHKMWQTSTGDVAGTVNVKCIKLSSKKMRGDKDKVDYRHWDELDEEERVIRIWSFANYLLFYMRKNGADVRLFDKNMYSCSKGLEKHVTIQARGDDRGYGEKKIREALENLGIHELHEKRYEIKAPLYDETGNLIGEADFATKLFYNYLIQKDSTLE